MGILAPLIRPAQHEGSPPRAGFVGTNQGEMMPTIKLSLSIGYGNAMRKEEEDIDDEFWASMTEKEREEYVDELAQDWADGYIEISAKVEE